MQKRIIDKRKKEKFLIDDEYINGQARICGWQATIVYNVLCRHASKEQECFPSIQLMAEKLNISRPTIIKGLQNLEKYNVIQIIKNRKSGQWINNTYILIDKLEWKKHQVNEVDTAHQVNENTPPSQREYKNQVNEVDTKETHTKETHIRKHIVAGKPAETEGQKINLLLKEFEIINPTINYGNKTQRKALQDMLKKFGYEKLLNTIKFAISIQGNQYAPTITTPYQLKENMGKLLVYYKKENNNKGTTFV